MSDGTKIEWTDATANVVNGCSVVSPGCTNCYAMRLAGTRMKRHPSRAGLTRDSKAGPVWTGEVRFHEPAFQQVLRWSAPRMIFWNGHSDFFHPSVPRAWQDRCYAGMALTPQHTHQVLTKRPELRREYLSDPETPGRIYDLVCDMAVNGEAHAVLIAPGLDEKLAPPGRKVRLGVWPLPNVWEGTSVEDQQRADERIPILLDTPAAVRWLSMEPLLGPVIVSLAAFGQGDNGSWPYANGNRIDWIVLGGESGLGARPMHPEWARSIRDQCAAAGVSFLFKQWGDWCPMPVDASAPIWSKAIAAERITHARRDGTVGEYQQANADQPLYRVGKREAGRLLDGVQHDGYPA